MKTLMIILLSACLSFTVNAQYNLLDESKEDVVNLMPTQYPQYEFQKEEGDRMFFQGIDNILIMEFYKGKLSCILAMYEIDSYAYIVKMFNHSDLYLKIGTNLWMVMYSSSLNVQLIDDTIVTDEVFGLLYYSKTYKTLKGL